MNVARSPYNIEVDLTGVSGVTGSKVELFLWNTGSQPTGPHPGRSLPACSSRTE